MFLLKPLWLVSLICYHLTDGLLPFLKLLLTLLWYCLFLLIMTYIRDGCKIKKGKTSANRFVRFQILFDFFGGGWGVFPGRYHE